MSPQINYHSFKNRYLLRAYHQGPRNFLLTLLPATLRDLAAFAWVVGRERSSLAAYAWLWRQRRQIAARAREIRARRSEPRGRIDRWFWTSAAPLEP